MSKLKTKKSASKRFKLTASGQVKSYQAGKAHGMIKRTNTQIRNQRGSTILSDQAARIVKKFLPYGEKYLIKRVYGKSKKRCYYTRKT